MDAKHLHLMIVSEVSHSERLQSQKWRASSVEKKKRLQPITNLLARRQLPVLLRIVGYYIVTNWKAYIICKNNSKRHFNRDIFSYAVSQYENKSVLTASFFLCTCSRTAERDSNKKGKLLVFLSVSYIARHRKTLPHSHQRLCYVVERSPR